MTLTLSEKITALSDAGVTQALIEEQTGIPQYRVSRIGSGATKRPSWSDVDSINQLYVFVVIDGKPCDEFKQSHQSEAC